MTKIQMYLVVLIILTMLPTLVTATPLPSLTRDNVAKRNDPNVLRYLVQYGHLDDKLDERNVLFSQKLRQQPNMAEPRNAFYTDDEILNGIKSFQNSFGLEASGDLNEETIKLMDSPRCGMSDMKNTLDNPFQLKKHHRSRRYTIKHKTRSGDYKVFKWSKTTIAWEIETYYTGTSLSRKQQVETFDKAFKLWEYASPLRFVRRTTQLWADIEIEFLHGFHGDGSPFDGKGGRLAHAFLPGSGKSGDIHFDAAEIWTPQYLLDVAIHEIGHTMGLGHSSVYASIMYPTYKTDKGTVTTLPQDDKNGLDKLYGPCETKIDAVIDLPNEDVYFIRKDLVWKYDGFGERVYSGYPKKVNDEFPTASGPKIPSDLDGATRFTYPFYGISRPQHFIFAKGDTLYIYDEDKKKITVQPMWLFWYRNGRPAVPSNVDAIVTDTDTEVQTWVFKDDQVWEISNWGASKFVMPDSPEKISASSQFVGLPKNMDDGYYDDFRHIYYFFKGTQYWMIKHEHFSTSHAIIPGGFIHQKWKGICSAKY